MSFDVEAVAREAWDRSATAAGAVLLLAAGAVGVVQTVASQDLLRAFLEEIREPFLDAMREEDPELAAEYADIFDQALADLPLALGLSPGVASVLWLAGFVVSLAVTVVAIDAFGNARDRITGLEVGGLGRKVLHVFLGFVAIGIAVFLGTFAFLIGAPVVALLALFLLPYFPVAIVLDDHGFWSGFKRSYGVVKRNLGSTVLVVLLAILVTLVLDFAGGLLTGPLPAATGLVIAQFVGAIGFVFTWALLARAYVAATTEEVTDAADGPAEGGDVHEEW